MITLVVELSCDHDGCDTAYAPSVEELTSVQLTRVGATIAGWMRRDKQDLCPQHSQTGESPEVSQVRALAGQGRNDSQIATVVGRPRWWVQQLRAKHGIKAGVAPGRPARRRTQPRQAEVVAS